MASASSSGCSVTPVSAAWSVSRPPWKNSSCGTTSAGMTTTECWHSRPPSGTRSAATRFGFHRHSPNAPALPASRPNHPADVGITPVTSIGHRLHRQHRKDVPRPSGSCRLRRLDHGQPRAAGALRADLQRQPRRDRHLESRDVPLADRRGGHPHRHPSHSRRRGNRSRRASGIHRGGPIRRPHRGRAVVIRGVGGHRCDRRGRACWAPASRRAGRWRSGPRWPARAWYSPRWRRWPLSCRQARGSLAVPHSPRWPPRSRCAPSATRVRKRCRGSRRWAGLCRFGRTRATGGGCCCCTWRRRRCSSRWPIACSPVAMSARG